MIYRRQDGKKDIPDTRSSADFSEEPRSLPSREEVELTPLLEVHKQSVTQTQNLEDTTEQDEIDATNGIDVSQSATVDNATDTNPPVKGIEPTPSVRENEESLSHHHEFNAYGEALETPDDQEIAAHNAPIAQLFDSGESDQVDRVPADSGHDQTRNESEPPVSNRGGSEEIPSFLPDDNADIRAVSPLGSDILTSAFLEEREAPWDDLPGEVTKPKEQDKTKRESPRNIKGRRYRSTTTRRGSGSRRRHISRPELLCRRCSHDPWKWEIVLSADDECRIKEVHHDNEPLDMVGGECCLSSFDGRLSIVCENDESNELPLFDGKPLIFKLRKGWKGDGRKVERMTKGYFVVIAPKEWEQMGYKPVESEGCTDTDFKVHYFSRDGNESGEDIVGFLQCNVPLSQSRFELTGNRVFDDSDDGDLFVGDVPNLKPSQEIVWVRVGEESENGWCENFETETQTLADTLSGRQGRFFIRVYDAEVKFLDSGEFRYLCNLKEIRVNGEPYTANALLVPPSTGHPPAEVRFIGTDGATIPPILVPDETHATVRDGIVTVEPHPSGDCIICTLGSDAGSVDVSISLPRIWWWLKRDHGESEEWCDTPFSMTRQKFRQYANADYAIRLRLPPCVASVKVGFDEELDRAYRPKQKGNEAEIHLDEFADYRQIVQRLNEDAFLNVQCDEEVLALIRISADPVPTIISFASKPASVAAGQTATLHWDTRNVESNGVDICPGIGLVESSGSRPVTPAETTTYTLRLTASGLDDVTKSVIVTVPTPPQLDPPSKHCALEKRLFARVKRTSGGWRNGKGFSHAELKGASLTLANAKRLRIPIDRRRRSTHLINIEMIKELINA